jgi:ribulose-phosphate 3-epimerase
MLKCAASLWSADLANLAGEMRRVEPYAERFHIDVADGQYVPALLFFPDLVAALRPHTRLPLEVHLIVRDPLAWVQPFVQAGADSIIFYRDAVPDPQPVIDAVKALGREVGLALRVQDPVELAEPYLEQLDILTLLGTEIGVKGAGMDLALPGKIRRARALIDGRGLPAQLEADGGIRWETVPLIHAAGAHYIVPGSLMFREGPARLNQFLAGLSHHR